MNILRAVGYECAGKPQWLLRIPQIRAEISALAVPVVDRAVIEGIFRVRRRRAIESMHGFRGYQAGRTFLVDREDLLAHVTAIEAGDDYVHETHRREQLAARVERMRRLHVGEAVRIPADPHTLSMRVPTLDRSIRSQPGRLESSSAARKIF